LTQHLRGRVTIASVAVLAGGLLAVGIAVNLLLAKSLHDDANKVLRERAAAQLAALSIEGGRVRPRENSDDAVLDQLSWVFAGSREIERPPTRRTIELAARQVARAPKPTFVDVSGETRLLNQPIREGGRQVATIVVGVRLEPYVHTEHLAVLATGLLALFVLLIGGFVARGAVGSALRPVAEMSARAEDWSEHDLHRRFDLGPPRDEITGLAATLDGMLARIDAALRHEQRFSAEMAHELRTPLSGVRAEAELALHETADDPETRAAFERVLAGTDRMAAVIETLLATERAGTKPVQSACDAEQAVAEVVSVMRAAAGARGVEIIARPGESLAMVLADRDMVAQAFQPLLDNAIGHATSRVDVSVEPRDQVLVIAVEDDGAGIADADPDLIFGPGHSTTGGAGLGLPLARRLARSLGGDVVAVFGQAGGGRFELHLPRTHTRQAARV
jgi:two-component system, OmpR family, sensor kinase